ncbi:hypothetical protein BJF78_30400 [Pseudonocardia sp. CNS-139]|nr:hypothetical protein BJF78_30400 [Pseudonocardia sp. CNS-139]
MLREHPVVAGLVIGRTFGSDAGRAVAERLLALLGAMGHPADGAAMLGRFLLTSAVTLVTSVGWAAPPGAATRPPTGAVLTTLPPERYPHLTQAAEVLATCGVRPFYDERSLSLLVAGLAALPVPAGTIEGT